MTGNQLINLLTESHRRSHLIGSIENGVIIALDLEGRLFTVVNGKVLSRVVPSAITNRSTKHSFQNPGGDALWPAPEGTILGYEYSTGDWRVPPSITGAVWEVVSKSSNGAVARAEIDLINNQQRGIPCEFERHIYIEVSANRLVQHVTEVIRYIGAKEIDKGDFLLAPWSLCQFDSGTFGKVIIPVYNEESTWDMYESSENQRSFKENNMIVETETPKRFQIAMDEKVEWLKYVAGTEFSVKRFVSGPSPGQRYIDIADSPPTEAPLQRGVKLSLYCDPSGFMEIEACGGCPEILTPGIEMKADITTEFIIHEQANT